MRTWLIVGTAMLIACVVAIYLRPAAPLAGPTATDSRGPWFAVRVEKPPANRPLAGLFGIIPSDDLAFDAASRGAAMAWRGKGHLELKAEGWDLSIEIDSEGRVTPATRLVFPSWLRRGDDPKPVSLRCRPADPKVTISGFKGWRSRVEGWDGDVGHLRVTPGGGASEPSGDFVVELATCENVESGRPLDWPNAPLVVRGRFDRLSTRASDGALRLP